MLCSVNLKNNNKVDYNYLINKYLLGSQINDTFAYVISDAYETVFDKYNIYDYVIDVLNKLKGSSSYVLNINLKFESLDFIRYINNNYKYITTKVVENDTNKKKLLIVGDHIIALLENFKDFIDVHKDKKLIKKLKNKFKKYNINFVLLSHEKGYNIMNIISRKYNFIENLIFIDCIRDLIQYVLPYETNFIYVKLMNLLKLRKSDDYTLSSSFSYIYNIYFNIEKLKLHTYKKPYIKEYLQSKLFNQNEVIDSVISYTNKLKTQLKLENKPIGSWLLCGPSGTGKTELAKILAHSLFDSKNSLLKIDMSEYMEKHSVSKLIGSPPGYEGHGEENILSKHFKYNSSSVVLFDEIEKAHKDINNLMLQILDEGRVTLSDGYVLNFNKSFIIFTSNLGYSNDTVGNKIDKKYIFEEINKFFKVEFLNRLNNIIIFNPIDSKNYFNILNKFIKESSIKFNFCLNIKNIFKHDLIKYSYNVLYGSRPIKRFNDFIFNKIYLNCNMLKNEKDCVVSYLSNFNKCIININYIPSMSINSLSC